MHERYVSLIQNISWKELTNLIVSSKSDILACAPLSSVLAWVYVKLGAALICGQILLKSVLYTEHVVTDFEDGLVNKCILYTLVNKVMLAERLHYPINTYSMALFQNV